MIEDHRTRVNAHGVVDQHFVMPPIKLDSGSTKQSSSTTQDTALTVLSTFYSGLLLCVMKCSCHVSMFYMVPALW